MDNVNSFLADWSIRFFENKDAVRGEIVKIGKISEVNFVIYYKDKIKYFIVMPVFDDSIFNRIENEKYFGIIVLNNPANVRFVVSEWKRLTDFRFLSIYFVNPFSILDKVWTICPYIHEKICDKASLELGLRSMAEMVDNIGTEELNKKIKLLGEESGQ